MSHLNIEKIGDKFFLVLSPTLSESETLNELIPVILAEFIDKNSIELYIQAHNEAMKFAHEAGRQGI